MKKHWPLFIVVSLAMLTAWFFLVFTPTRTEQARITGEIDALERQLLDFNRTIGELPRFLEANENLEMLKGELNSSLFAKGDLLKLFQQIEEESARYNLKLLEITPPVSELLELNRLVVADNQPQFLTITLTFDGKYVDFGRYVTALESQPYYRDTNYCIVRGGYTLTPTVSLTISFKALIGTPEASA